MSRGWGYYFRQLCQCPFLAHIAFREYRNGNTQSAIHVVLSACHGLGQLGLMRRIMKWDAGYLTLTTAFHCGDRGVVERFRVSGADIDAVTPRGVSAFSRSLSKLAEWILRTGCLNAGRRCVPGALPTRSINLPAIRKPIV